MTQSVTDPQLRQRGRASIEFMAKILGEGGRLSKAVDEQARELVGDIDALPDDLDDRIVHMDDVLGDSDTYGSYTLLGDWIGRMHGVIATEAFDEAFEDLEPTLKAAEHGPASLELNPQFEPPKYWDGVNFHRTAGGWTGHPYQGLIHGELVHRKLVAVAAPGGIAKPRKAVAEMAPKAKYDKILEMGCSSGHYTMALQDTYPEAEIHGVELSAQMLEHAWRMANENGFAWHLYQRPAEATGFDDASFDLVTSFILLHEIPASAVTAVFAEAFRVCKPGGDFVMSDVTRFADLDKVAEWKSDLSAKHGGEPHWRESASLDFAAIAKEVGFVDVTADGIYPHVVKGRKPQ